MKLNSESSGRSSSSGCNSQVKDKVLLLNTHIGVLCYNVG